MAPRGDDIERLELRLPARSSHSALLRARLRLWLAANRAGDEDDVLDVLGLATREFLTALSRPGPVRTIEVRVEASYRDGVVRLAVHDHAGPAGNTVQIERLLAPAVGSRPRRAGQWVATP